MKIAVPVCVAAAASVGVLSSAFAAPSTAALNARHHLAQQAAFASAAPTMTPTVTAMEMLTAMDIDSASVLSASVVGDARAFTVFPGLGALTPTRGSTFTFLSTGVAGAGTPQSLDPSSFGVESGTSLAGGAGCPDGDGYDCTRLTFSFVVPTGMHSVKFDFNFMSAEYPEFVGAGFDDAFLVSEASASNNFSNIVFDAHSNPVDIDSAYFNQPCDTLTGSGFDIYSFGNTCDAGATGLLTTAAPVAEGENVTLVFSIRDRQDSIYDSAVMIDNFVLSTEMVVAPTTDGQIKIDWLTPKSGPIAGGTQIQVHGQGFVNVSQVSFGGVPALFSTLDDQTMVVVSPAASYPATVDLAITGSPNGSPTTGVKVNGFMYFDDPGTAPLSVENVDPPEGPLSGNVDVVIRGTGFVNGSVVSFAGDAASQVEFIGGDQLIARTPAGHGPADVRVTNPDGTSTTLSHGYLYVAGTGEGGAGPHIGGCGCSLVSGSTPATPVATGSAVVGMLIAAWIVRRRRRLGVQASFRVRPALLFAGAALLVSGCENKVIVAPVNSGPGADAGPDQERFVNETVQLDGSGSHDFEGGNLSFAWSIVSAPEGSSATLSDPSIVNPTFTADRPGLYRVGLVVTDDRGADSGAIGLGGTPHDNLMDVVSLPFDDFTVSLDWDTDLSDLDLHVVRGSVPGYYFDPSSDCFFGVPTPDWGTYDIQEDNPVFNPDVPGHRDVDNGFGPEVVKLASPQDPGVYTIVVHEFNAHGAGATHAHVKITLAGTVIADLTSTATLDGTDAAWVAGTIQWPAGTWTAYDLMTNHQALGGPAH